MKTVSCIDIETTTESIYSIKILSNNAEQIQQEIERKTRSSNIYQDKPIIIDIHDKNFQANDLAVLVEILAQNELIAIGVRTSKQELIDFVKFSGLAIFSNSSIVKELNNSDEVISEKIKLPPKLNKDIAFRAPNIIAKKVNSDSQVYAKGCDLVLLNIAKIDSEVMSDGSISAYKEVRGKVFAGISGDTKSTIFIHSFKAQLISIAGVFKKFEVVPDKLFAQPVMIDLFEGKLRFTII
jgi:septum site-determining protein MinC